MFTTQEVSINLNIVEYKFISFIVVITKCLSINLNIVEYKSSNMTLFVHLQN